MKREILFRGKPIDENCEWKWIEGYLCIDCNDIQTIRHPLDTEIGGYRVLVVDPKTVGQFIGLHDRLGNKIFEGDIVKSTYCSLPYSVKFGHFYEDEEYPKSSSLGYYTSIRCGIGFDVDGCVSYEVVGNVYDNPQISYN
jgi:uncharacterized phage protein (TIGR01671 family)